MPARQIEKELLPFGSPYRPETGEARFTAIRHCQRVRLPYTSVGGQSTKLLFSGEHEYVGSFTLGGRGCAAVIFQDFFEDQPLQKPHETTWWASCGDNYQSVSAHKRH